MLDKHVYLYFLKVAGLDPSKVLKYEGNQHSNENKYIISEMIFLGVVFDKVLSFPFGLVPK